MIRDVAQDRVTYGDPPHKFEAGTPPMVQAIGLGAAIDYVNSIGKARIAAHEQDLAEYAHERLGEIKSLRLIGMAKDKGPLISFELKGVHPHDVATIIDRQGVAVRAGTHCAMPLIKRFGVPATCRASWRSTTRMQTLMHSLRPLLRPMNCSHEQATPPQAIRDGSVASPLRYVKSSLRVASAGAGEAVLWRDQKRGQACWWTMARHWPMRAKSKSGGRGSASQSSLPSHVSIRRSCSRSCALASDMVGLGAAREILSSLSWCHNDLISPYKTVFQEGGMDD